MKVIEFENVTKSFGDKKVLDGLSFSVEKGEIFVILGLRERESRSLSSTSWACLSRIAEKSALRPSG